MPLTVVLLGATGDLVRTKIVPALFALDCQGLLPRSFRIVGLARTPLDDAAFRARLGGDLTCRSQPADAGAERAARFLERCAYCQGAYGDPAAFGDLGRRLAAIEGGAPAQRIFYLATPPAVFAEAVAALGRSGLAAAVPGAPPPRLVVEKPFGVDRASSDALAQAMAEVFDEPRLFRMDHYLGKEVIQNLLVLRFANLVFEPLWNRDAIASVRITWQEEAGVGGRGGYFDQAGILRDVFQNHLLQMLALAAMEPPGVFSADAVRAEKIKLLSSVEPLAPGDLVVGQYTAGERDGRRWPAYREEPHVAPGSRTPTFMAARLRVRNRRWDGVPFLVRAGKALDRRVSDIEIRFRPVPGNLFCRDVDCLPPNRLVIRVQPDEAIVMRVVNKLPGIGLRLAEGDLDLRYATAFRGPIPDAYERLLLDVIQGDRSLFVGAGELAAAWDIVTPALQDLERRRVVPDPYPGGSRGPASAADLEARAARGG